MEADKKTTTEELGFFKKYGFYLALAVLAVIVMLPNPEGLSVAGQRMIGIMVFSVIVWATTAISYPVSAGVIMTLMALLIGFSPNPETGKLFGTAAGLGIGLKGFASTAFCLVAAAMFLAVAMTKTGLDKRIYRAGDPFQAGRKIEPRRYRRHPLRLYPQLFCAQYYGARSLPRTDRYGYDQSV